MDLKSIAFLKNEILIRHYSNIPLPFSELGLPLRCSRYSSTISSVIFKVLHVTYPTAQKYRPQYFLPREGNSFSSIWEERPFNFFTKLLRGTVP